jgi:hypothetical protein
MPNLLQDPPSYVNAFFDYYGNKYKDRKRMKLALLKQLVYGKLLHPKIKKHIDNHRAFQTRKTTICLDVCCI